MAERRLTLVDAANPVATAIDVVVHGDDATPLDEVRDALAQHAPPNQPLFVGSALFPSEGTLGDAPLVDGDRVSWGGPVAPAAIDRRWTRWELRVVGGPAAGKVVPLPPGRHEIGRAGDLVSLVADGLLSRRHVCLEVSDDKVMIEDLGSSNGTEVEGRAVEEQIDLEPGAVVQVGATLLTVVAATVPELKLVPQPDGRRGLNRRFRPGEDELPTDVAFPAKPEPGDRPGLNVLILVAPALLIGVLVLALDWPPTMLMFMVMSPILGLGGAIARRKQHDKKVARDFERFKEQALEAKDRLLGFRQQETEILRRRHPDPAATVQCARAAGRLLWARRGMDPDLLEVRVGSASRRSSIRAQNAETDDSSLWMTPVTVNLPAVGGLGIVGEMERGRALARSLVIQAATLHSPAELRLVTLTSGDEGERSWSWVRWLPHSRWAADEEFVLAGSDDVSTRYRLEELKDLISRRRQAKSESGQDSRMLPLVLVVHDDAARLLSLGFAEILRDGPAVGVHNICIDRLQVPEGCDASVSFGPDGNDGVLERAGQPTVSDIVLDGVDAETCAVAARCLAPVKVIGEEAAVELPPHLRLLDLVDLPTPSADAVSEGWTRTSRDPGAPVGVTTAGPMSVDLTRDGPHGVIAGATRSGKSEFLKTFIASLAARNHPDDLGFLFIDFKGGNDYQLAATLPHTVDLATQIDQAGFERSLQLLEAEIIRRQQIAATLNTSTIEGYWAAQESEPAGSTPTMGRLVVIADEFAELAQKNPDQLNNLVSVARVGAAYGVHLILATQRPAGVVSGQIDANSPLRVCFRTTAKEHSSDVLGSPVAAEIAERHRGRGYKKSHQELPLEFQCARVANARPGTRTEQTPLRVVRQPWLTAGHLPPPERTVGEVPDQDTDFYDLTQAIRQAARDSGWTRNAVPWPKPLPEVVDLSSLPPLEDDEMRSIALPIGLVDDPNQQAHLLATVELGKGHVCFAGASASGRTTALRTVAASAATSHGARDLHIYAIDASGGLGGLTQLPHCGGVAIDDSEVAGRILDQIDSAVRDRRSRFETVGASDLLEYNAHPDTRPEPWLLMLVDGWDVIHEDSQTAAGSALHDRILRVLGDGQRFGVQGVIAGDRWAATGKAGRLMAHRYVLRFNSDVDYDTAGVRAAKVPDQMPSGRAIGDDGRLHQVGVLGDGSGAGQAEGLRALAESLQAEVAGQGSEGLPRRIQSLPTKVLVDDLIAQEPPPSGKVPALVGYSTGTSGPLWLDLGVEARSFLVAGARRSGRSTALMCFAESARRAGVSVVVVCPRPSPLQQLEGRDGIVELLSDDAATSASFAGVADLDRALVVIDDIEALDPNSPGLLALLQAAHPARSVVAAATVEGAKNAGMGALPQIKRGRSGLLLCPTSVYDGAALGGGSLPRHLLFDQPEGRGVLSIGGEHTIVQVAVAD